MGKQQLKVLTEPTRPAEDGGGHTCPHCGKKRPGETCPHSENCPHRGKCRHHRQKAGAEDGSSGDPDHPQPQEHEPGEVPPEPPEQELQAEAGEPGEGGGAGRNGHNFIDLPSEHGPSCQGPHCVNLNFLRELPRLNLGMAQLQRQEKSLLRYLARTDHMTVEGFVLSLLLEPVFEFIEQVYGAADELRHHAAQDTTPGSPCPFASLINGLERRLRLYLRMDQGLDEEAGAEMAELFDETDISSAQILAELTVDQGDELFQMPN